MSHEQEDTIKSAQDLEAMFRLCPRYDKHELTNEQIEGMVLKAAIKANELNKEEFERSIGRRAITFVYYVLGAFVLGLFSVGIKLGFIKF